MLATTMPIGAEWNHIPMPPPITNVEPISTRSKPAKPPRTTSTRINTAPPMTSTQFHKFIRGTSVDNGLNARVGQRLWAVGKVAASEGRYAADDLRRTRRWCRLSDARGILVLGPGIGRVAWERMFG